MVGATASSHPVPHRHRGAARVRPSDATLAVLVLIGLFAGFVVVQRGVILSYDGDIMLQVSENLLRHGSLRVSHDSFGFNTPYSSYGIGVPLLQLPFVALHRWTHTDRDQWAGR